MQVIQLKQRVVGDRTSARAETEVARLTAATAGVGFPSRVAE